jgi:hypothetical protein
MVSLKCGGVDDISIWERFKGRTELHLFGLFVIARLHHYHVYWPATSQFALDG